MNNSADISKTCRRNSNVEAMRIIAMIMILMLHFNNFQSASHQLWRLSNSPCPHLPAASFSR